MRTLTPISLALLLLAAPALAQEPPAIETCTRWASPTGGGDGLSSGAPTTIATMNTTITSGHVWCLKGTNPLTDGLYTGASNMINVVNRPCAQNNRCVIRAETFGKVLIDAEWMGTNASPRYTVSIDGTSSYLRVRGLFLRNGFNGNVVIKGTGTGHEVLETVGWDIRIDANATMFQARNSGTALFDMVACIGTARKCFSNSQSDGTGNLTTYRRVFACWGGSIRTGPKTDVTLVYNSRNAVLETGLLGWCGESQPQTHYRATAWDSTKAWAGSRFDANGRERSIQYDNTEAQYTNFNMAEPYGPLAIDRLDSNSFITGPTGARAEKCANVRADTVLSFHRTGANNPSTGYLGNTFVSKLSCVTLRNILIIEHNNRHGFRTLSQTTQLSSGVTLPSDVPAGTTQLFGKNWTSLLTNASSPGNEIGSRWVEEGTGSAMSSRVRTFTTLSSLLSTHSPFVPNHDGAQFCYETIGGQATTTPIFPWRNREMIIAATSIWGHYQGPCLEDDPNAAGTSPTCGGEPTVTRPVLDPDAIVSGMLGTIPEQCVRSLSTTDPPIEIISPGTFRAPVIDRPPVVDRPAVVDRPLL